MDGAIWLDKLFSYPISFSCNRAGKYKFKSIEKIDITLRVKNENNIYE